MPLPKLLPDQLDATDTPSDGESPTYNDAAKKFEWKPASGLTNPVDVLEFNTSYAKTEAEPVGAVYWNSEDGVPDVVLPNGVTGQMFLEDFFDYKNQTGSTLTNGMPLMFAGTLGASGILLAQPAIADGSLKSEYIIGIATHDTLTGASGKATWRGKVRKIDTSGTPYSETWSDGDLIWVSQTTAGYLTNVEPAGGQKILVAAVVFADDTVGELLVRPTWEQDAIKGTGIVGQVAEFVTDTKTIQAAKLIAPTGGILTLVSASAYSLTAEATGIIALLNRVGGQIFTTAQTINVNSTTALLIEQDGVKDNVIRVDTTNGRVVIGTPTVDDITAGLIVGTFGVDKKGIVIQRTSGQGANIFEYQSHTGTLVLMKINSSGHITTNRTFCNDFRGIANSNQWVALTETDANNESLLIGNAGINSTALVLKSTGKLNIGSSSVASSRFQVTGGSDVIQEIVKAHSTQTNNLVEHQDSSAGIHNIFNVTVGKSNVLNETGADIDTRIETDLRTHAIFVDASANSVSFNEAAPLTKFEVTESNGHSGFWSGTAIDGTAQVIIANATGDVTKAISLLYTANEITGTDTSGGQVSLEPGDTHTVLVDGPGGNILTLTVNANGEVSIARSSGTDTFEFSAWMVWR